MLIADALDVLAAFPGQPEKRADVVGSFGQLREEDASILLARCICSRRLLALASSEHNPSSVLPPP